MTANHDCPFALSELSIIRTKIVPTSSDNRGSTLVQKSAKYEDYLIVSEKKRLN